MTVSRWPLHPPPAPGEALSSWLARIAAAHHLELFELLENNLGDYTFDYGGERADLDVDPPTPLLAAVEERTGRDREELRAMTIAATVPWLLDTLEPCDDPAAFETYVRQHHVLLPQWKGILLKTPRWRAWMPARALRRACPACVTGPDAVAAITLVSQLPLTLSCPIHGCYLEPDYALIDGGVFWGYDETAPRPAPPAVVAMDRCTHDALRCGVVGLARRTVHAGVWFRLLRTIIDELDSYPSHAGSHARTLRAVWDSIDQPPRGGPHRRLPFEALDWPRQQLLLEATASAIQMIAERTIRAVGVHGDLFLPEPPLPVGDGRPAPWSRRGAQPLVDYWKAALNSVNDAVALARTDPTTAEELYRLLIHGPGGRDVALRVMADVGITTFPSSRNPLPVPVLGT